MTTEIHTSHIPYSLCSKSQITPVQFSSLKSSHSVTSDSATPWTATRQASLSITSSWSLLKLVSIKSVMPSNHLILYHPLLLLPSIFPSIRVFTNESVLRIRWPKYWSFSFSISPSNEYLRLIFFRIDGFDLLAVQGTLKSLFQHHSSKASIFQCSAFLIAQVVKNLLVMQETPVQFLGQENLLEKGLVTHSSILGLHVWLSW